MSGNCLNYSVQSHIIFFIFNFVFTGMYIIDRHRCWNGQTLTILFSNGIDTSLSLLGLDCSLDKASDDILFLVISSHLYMSGVIVV